MKRMSLIMLEFSSLYIYFKKTMNGLSLSASRFKHSFRRSARRSSKKHLVLMSLVDIKDRPHNCCFADTWATCNNQEIVLEGFNDGFFLRGFQCDIPFIFGFFDCLLDIYGKFSGLSFCVTNTKKICRSSLFCVIHRSRKKTVAILYCISDNISSLERFFNAVCYGSLRYMKYLCRFCCKFIFWITAIANICCFMQDEQNARFYSIRIFELNSGAHCNLVSFQKRNSTYLINKAIGIFLYNFDQHIAVLSVKFFCCIQGNTKLATESEGFT